MGFPGYALLCFGSLMSIVDPFAALPIFLALTGTQDPKQRARTALVSTATCFTILTTFALAGTFIFSFFGITIPAFKIAGGILLFGVGLEMMRGKESETRTTAEEKVEAEAKEDIAIIPMGLPLLSGPGAIATVMVLVGKASGWPQRFGVYAAIVAVSVVTFLVLRSAEIVARMLGRTGINLIGRVMGLILAATSVQFVIDGAHEAFPKLLG
ncbi:MAG TPA: MarC family protein [Polyangiaceae bacterium]|jgi:multiple antibiotic resistance protein